MEEKPVTVKEALDFLDERNRRKNFIYKTRYSRDKSREEFTFDRAAYQEDYFNRKRAEAQL